MMRQYLKTLSLINFAGQRIEPVICRGFEDAETMSSLTEKSGDIFKQEGHDGPVLLHWLTHEIPSYQALQYLGIGLKHRPLTRTKIGSHSSYVKHHEDFKRLHHMKPCKTCNPWQSIRP